jgi:hypothetical protein
MILAEKIPVSKREPTADSLLINTLRSLLPDGLLDAASLPDLPAPSDSKRESTAQRAANGCQPGHNLPLPPHHADRQQSEGNGAARAGCALPGVRASDDR